MSEESNETKGIQDALEKQSINIIFSKPSYANYIKTLQYLPNLIIISLPKLYTNELNYLQMVKQHKVAREIPIVCYGSGLPAPIIDGLKKIGVDEYFELPLDITGFVKAIIPRLGKQLQTTIPAGETITDNAATNGNDLSSQILSKQTTGQKKIELICSYISDLMAFPFSVSKILKMTNSTETNASDLARVIETDPVLATKLLQVSNSAFFGGGRSHVSSVKNAVMRIGFSETRRIAMSMSIMNLFDNEQKTPGFNRVNFWYHCLSTAVIAEYLAARIPGVNKDEAFLCGLLHDFGLILLDEFLPDVFSHLVTIVTNSGGHFIDKERERLSITHQDIIKVLFEKWNIPAPLIAGICGYSSIVNMAECPKDTSWQLPVCVAHGNQFSKAMMLGVGCDQFVVPLPVWTWQKAGCLKGITDDDRRLISTTISLFHELINISFDQTPSKVVNEADLSCIKIGYFRHKVDAYGPTVEYLKSKGHSVEHINDGSDFILYNNTFDIIIVEISPVVTNDKLQILASVNPRTMGELLNTDNQQMPLLLLLAKESKISVPPSITKCSVLYNDLDLRNLDLSIGLLLMKTPANLLHPSKVLESKAIESASKATQGTNADIKMLHTVATKLRFETKKHNLSSPLVDKAESLFTDINSAIQKPGYNVLSIEIKLQLVTLYYRKILLQNELFNIEPKIVKLEGS